MAIHSARRNPAECEVQYRQLFDAETGLAGEVLLRDRLAVSLARARRFNRCVLVVWFEIDTPEGSDAATIARAVGGGLQDSIRPDDTVARVDDREFVVLCNDLAHHEAVERIVRRLHRAIRRTAAHDDGSEPLAQIGAALGQANQDAQHVLLRAREALKPVGHALDERAAS